MFFCVELGLLFSAGQLINSMRMPRCQAVVQALGSSTRYWALVMSLKSMNTDEIKDPCDNKHDKHENLCKSSPCHFICMPLLWLMWWTFWEIKWLRVLFLNAHTSLFVCLFVVCLLTVHTFVWIHINVHVRMHNNERHLETLSSTQKQNWVIYQTWVILQLFKFDLTPHFKALHLHVSHNHNK